MSGFLCPADCTTDGIILYMLKPEKEKWFKLLAAFYNAKDVTLSVVRLISVPLWRMNLSILFCAICFELHCPINSSKFSSLTKLTPKLRTVFILKHKYAQSNIEIAGHFGHVAMGCSWVVRISLTF
jgi:hypothetical protein